jgi:hypothetical protein
LQKFADYTRCCDSNQFITTTECGQNIFCNRTTESLIVQWPDQLWPIFKIIFCTVERSTQMRTILLAIAIVLGFPGLMREECAACIEGTTRPCTTSQGTPGIRECISGRFQNCLPLDTLTRPTTQGNPGNSSVKHGSDNTLGTTLSSNSSFK